MPVAVRKTRTLRGCRWKTSPGRARVRGRRHGPILASLPFPNEERLVILWQSNPERGVARELVSAADFVDWDAQNTIFEALGAWPSTSETVADVRSSALDLPPQPEVFFSYRQYPWYNPTLLVRTDGDPLPLAAAIRREAAALNSRAVVTDVTTMQQIAADSIGQPRFRAALIGLFAALAILLGMLGIYGVMSYAAAQRTQEIGIRMALGATAYDAAWLVVGQTIRTAGIGLVVGMAAAWIAARWMASLLYGVGSADPMTMVGTCLLFGGAALVAGYIPSRRAAAVDPSVALRSE